MVDDDDGGKCCGDLCRELLVARCASWSWRAHFGAAWMSAVFSSVGSSTGKLSPISHASSLNYAAGQTIPNVVIAKLGAGGKCACSPMQGSTCLPMSQGSSRLVLGAHPSRTRPESSTPATGSGPDSNYRNPSRPTRGCPLDDRLLDAHGRQTTDDAGTGCAVLRRRASAARVDRRDTRLLERGRCSDTTLASSTPSRVSPFGDRIVPSSVACRPVASRRLAPTWTARCIEQDSSE